MTNNERNEWVNKPSPERTQVGVRFPNELLAKLDGWRDGSGVGRSTAICILIAQALNAHERGQL